MGRAWDEQVPGCLLSPGSWGMDVLDKPKGIKGELGLLVVALETLARALPSLWQ